MSLANQALLYIPEEELENQERVEGILEALEAEELAEAEEHTRQEQLTLEAVEAMEHLVALEL